jgi:hypothetical protein
MRFADELWCPRGGEEVHMKRVVVAAVVSGVMVAGAAGVSAGQRGKSGAGPKVTSPKAASGGQTPRAPQGGNRGGQGSAAAKAGGQGPGAAAHGGGRTTGGAQATNRKPARTDGAAAITTSTTAANGSTPAGTRTLTPVQQKLERNTQLADRLRSRLPAGTNLMDAVDGFRNLGQAVAAINVSSNHGIPFTELKTRMVDDGMSLGQAIKDVRSTSDAEASTIARQADADATTLIRSTETETAKKAPKAKSRG